MVLIFETQASKQAVWSGALKDGRIERISLVIFSADCDKMHYPLL